MKSQGFRGLPLAVASFRHVTVTHAGLTGFRLALCVDFIDRVAPFSITHYTPASSQGSK
jgi:hypothetical protein